MTGAEYTHLESVLTKLSEKQNDISESIVNINNNLMALHNSVVGNEIYGHKGLVREVSDIKKYIDNDRKIKNRIIGGLLVVGGVWTFFLEIWKKLL